MVFLLLILLAAPVARADSTEKAQIADLQHQLASANIQILDLRRQVSRLTDSALKSQTKTSTEKQDVLQQQSESTDTINVVVQVAKAQKEYEKQLSALQIDLHKVVNVQQASIYLMCVIALLGLIFTGIIGFSVRSLVNRHREGLSNAGPGG